MDHLPTRADVEASAPPAPDVWALALSRELVRTALLAKLAVDLGHPALVRQAASDALEHARHLFKLDWTGEPEPRPPSLFEVLRIGVMVEAPLFDGDVPLPGATS